MKKIKTYTSAFLITLIFVLACKKEKPELNVSNQDPCGCASEVSADFVIEELLNPQLPAGLSTVTDHILSPRFASFTALEEDADYTWYIGSEILTQKSVTRFFNVQWVGYDIPITLVVRKNPNNTCFPNDDGYDSIVKYMHVYEKCETHLLEGVFRLAEENTTDSIDLILQQVNYPQTSDCESWDITNVNGNGEYCSGQNRIFLETYRELRTNLSGVSELQCPNNVHIELMRMNFDNTVYLKIGYVPNPQPNPFDNVGVWKELYGRKLN